MKKNFIISDIKNLWAEKSEDLFIVTPYVDYLLKEKNEDKNYKSIEVAEFLRNNRESMQEAADFIEQKYQKYIPILAKRLNKIHKTTYCEFFWKKSLSMAVTRYLTLFHDVFAKCEKYFDPDKYDCKILSKKSYYTPLDFEDHRAVFENTFFGQEQIFSHYINLFYPNQFESVDLNPEKFGCEFVAGVAKLKREKTDFELKEELKVLKRKLFAIFSKKYRQKLKKYEDYKIKVGILGSFFSSENIFKLFEQSNGQINTIEIDRYNQKMIDSTINPDKRNILGEFESNFDRFDKFFFSTLSYCFPRAFVENFNPISNSLLKKIKKYPNLKYVTSEAWLSDTYISIALAMMKEFGIKHIYNEHNGIFYPFIGNFVINKANLADYYVTFGWESQSIPNLISGASLFPFYIEGSFEKKYNILYVSSPTVLKMSYYGGYYGTSDINALKHLNFAKEFMANLSIETLKEIAYRGYPKEYDMKFLSYDKEKYLKNFLQYAHITKAIYAQGETCREQMLKSRLVIADYQTTAYLEALTMNIPVVLFFSPEVNYLKEEYSDFFKGLIDVGICQTDPVAAAKFIEKIANNPEEWWNSEEVQKARNEFLNKNFKKPQVMIDYLLNLVKE